MQDRSYVGAGQGKRLMRAGGALLFVLAASMNLPETRASSRDWLVTEACKVDRSHSSRSSKETNCSELDGLTSTARAAMVGVSTPQERIDRLNSCFFKDEGFEVTADLSSADFLLPSAVVAGKKGYCVGLALVYLILAEELELPIHGVSTPKHVFLRWDDGTFRRNIELFQEGREVPDENYIRDQKIPQESIDRGVFMANLTSKEFLGFVYQNLGVLESQAEHFEASRKLYERALQLNPKLAAAYYNLGNDYLHQKKYREAIRAYDKALKLYPGDAWALQNREIAEKAQKE